jgi:hypothetical protein
MRFAAGPQQWSGATPEDLPDVIGGFAIRQMIVSDADGKLLSGQELSLGRPVWLWLRALDGPALSPARRKIDRATRLRWLGGGELDRWRWDAFLSPSGCPLSQLVSRGDGLAWPDARPILEDVTEELCLASADGTLPLRLSVDQVWVQPNGQVQVLDRSPTAWTAGLQNAEKQMDGQRPLDLLRQLSVVSLEGAQRPLRGPGDRVNAPIPLHASSLLENLFTDHEADQQVAEFERGLAATRARPRTVTRSMRIAQLTVQLGELLAGAAVVGLMVGAYQLLWPWKSSLVDGTLNPETSIVLLLVLWLVAWAFLTRGGFSFRIQKLALVGSDGRRASRIRCGFRALVCWLPFGLLVLFGHVFAGVEWLRWTSLGLATLGSYVVLLLLWNPARALHDRLAATYLVPK